MARNSGYDLPSINVLVVDDSRNMRTLLVTILRSLRITQVREAADPAEAFRELKTFPADLVLCDWLMEPLDGLDFVRLVRTASDTPNPYLPIIMISGHTEIRRIHEARDAGVTEFLAKPVSPKALYERVIEVVEHPRPFVRTKGYFGPDRRRRDVGPPPNVGERRAQPSDVIVVDTSPFRRLG